MCGVTKMASSVRSRVTDCRLNSAPSHGMSISRGMPCELVCRESPINPAMTTVCPSRSTARVLASRVEITGALNAAATVCCVSELTSCSSCTET